MMARTSLHQTNNDLHEPIKKMHHDDILLSMEKQFGAFGEDEDDDCTTVTLSTSTSHRSDSHHSGPNHNNATTNNRLGGFAWATRFALATQENGLPSLALDQTNDVSPLSTPSPTQTSRKRMDDDQVERLPPLKEFGAQTTIQTPTLLQMQSLEAIMAKQQQQQKQHEQKGAWFWKQQQQQQQQDNNSTEEESLAAESIISNKSNASTSFRWGRFLGSSGSSNDTLDGDEEDNTVPSPKAASYQQRWKNRFSFRPSQMDTMLDDMDDPYLDSISLSSDCSSEYGGSTSSIYELLDEHDHDNDEHENNDDNVNAAKEGGEEVNIQDQNKNPGAAKPTHRRRWSRLWRAQEFSRDASTIHMV